MATLLKLLASRPASVTMSNKTLCDARVVFMAQEIVHIIEVVKKDGTFSSSNALEFLRLTGSRVPGLGHTLCRGHATRAREDGTLCR